MKYIIYDFEIFKYDYLLGALVVDGSKIDLYQTWNTEEMKSFFDQYKNDLWIGWNNLSYDDVILEAILTNNNPYLLSKKIVSGSFVKCNLDFVSYDLMKAQSDFLSLKLTELIAGKSIETTEVDFNIDRNLTEEEKRLTEKYNHFDLKQTLYNFRMFFHNFELRLEIIKEFNLPLKQSLNLTGTKLASTVLKAKATPSLIYSPVNPIMYDNLRLENEKLKNYYMNQGFRKDLEGEIIIGNAVLPFGKGGLHFGEKKVYYPKAMYADIKGAYNSVMIEYDLFSRAIPEEGKELYKKMFIEEKALKKTNPKKRKVYKPILLAVFGGQLNPHLDFYDPWNGALVPVVLQLFIVDLCEKIADKVEFVQVNTDGIMFVPKDWNDEQYLKDILEEWQKRTKFSLKIEYMYDIFQRDVNCYLFKNEKGDIEYKGEVFKNYDISDEGYSSGDIFNSKEPSIIAKGVYEFLVNEKDPMDTIKENKDLRNYQYSCKKGTYDYLSYEKFNIRTFEKTTEKLSAPLCRVFASNDKDVSGMIYKCKGTTKKTQAKVSNLPDNVFIYNGEILSEEAYEKLKDKIDYNYYYNRIRERIGEFL